MTEIKIKKVIINALHILEANTLQNQLKIAEILTLFDEESISEDGKQHIRILKK